MPSRRCSWATGAMILASFVCTCTPSSMRNGEGLGESISPVPREIRLSSDSVVKLAGATVDIAPALSRRFPVAVAELRSRLKPQPDDSLVSAPPPTLKIRVGVPNECDDRVELCHALRRPEGYWISIGGDTVVVVGADTLGALHGLSTLQSLITGDGRRVPLGEIGDWPRFKTRAFHFVADNLAREKARELVRRGRRLKYNTIIVQVADIRPLMDPPQPPARSGWDLGALDSLAVYVRRNGLSFVPELKLLTHQEKFFVGVRPDLLFNSWTYDPRKQETYEVVFGILSRVVQRLRPAAIHIGHDEVVGTGAPGAAGGKELPAGEEPLPASLFLKDIRTVHAHLASLGVETWMWGDMFLSTDEFPDMFPNHLHATPAYSALRSLIPDGVVICDWHYFGGTEAFPSALAFADAGQDVLGSTWKREEIIWNFSRAVAELDEHGRGMIATTWFHVQRKEWDLVDRILRVSSNAFWNPLSE